MENLGYKNQNIERKYLENMKNSQFFNVKKQSFRVRKRSYGIER